MEDEKAESVMKNHRTKRGKDMILSMRVLCGLEEEKKYLRDGERNENSFPRG